MGRQGLGSPRGTEPPMGPAQYFSLASTPVVSLASWLPVISQSSPGEGTDTAQLAGLPFQVLGRLPGPWLWQGGLKVQKSPGASQTPRRARIDGIRSGPRVLVSGSTHDDPGEAVKEPERTQEHGLPSFAGGQHFFEYLLVVSLKKKRSGEDYEPTITYQFPKVRTEGADRRVFERVAVGCPPCSPPCQGLSLELP